MAITYFHDSENSEKYLYRDSKSVEVLDIMSVEDLNELILLLVNKNPLTKIILRLVGQFKKPQHKQMGCQRNRRNPMR